MLDSWSMPACLVFRAQFAPGRTCHSLFTLCVHLIIGTGRNLAKAARRQARAGSVPRDTAPAGGGGAAAGGGGGGGGGGGPGAAGGGGRRRDAEDVSIVHQLGGAIILPTTARTAAKAAKAAEQAAKEAAKEAALAAAKAAKAAKRAAARAPEAAAAKAAVLAAGGISAEAAAIAAAAMADADALVAAKHQRQQNGEATEEEDEGVDMEDDDEAGEGEDEDEGGEGEQEDEEDGKQAGEEQHAAATKVVLQSRFRIIKPAAAPHRPAAAHAAAAADRSTPPPGANLSPEELAELAMQRALAALEKKGGEGARRGAGRPRKTPGSEPPGVKRRTPTLSTGENGAAGAGAAAGEDDADEVGDEPGSPTRAAAAGGTASSPKRRKVADNTFGGIPFADSPLDLASLQLPVVLTRGRGPSGGTLTLHELGTLEWRRQAYHAAQFAYLIGEGTGAARRWEPLGGGPAGPQTPPACWVHALRRGRGPCAVRTAHQLSKPDLHCNVSPQCDYSTVV